METLTFAALMGQCKNDILSLLARLPQHDWVAVAGPWELGEMVTGDGKFAVVNNQPTSRETLLECLKPVEDLAWGVVKGLGPDFQALEVEVRHLKAQLRLRNRQIRDLRRSLRK